MSRRSNRVPETALSQNHSFVAVDDYDNRMYILPYLVERADRERIVAEHRANPVYEGTRPGEPAPLHSETLRRLLDKLRTTPQRGKHTIVEIRPWREYAVGILSGRRGGSVDITDERYATRSEAEHAIFLKRLEAFLTAYGIAL
jgi:hypothetical protein